MPHESAVTIEILHNRQYKPATYSCIIVCYRKLISIIILTNNNQYITYRLHYYIVCSVIKRKIKIIQKQPFVFCGFRKEKCRNKHWGV